MAKALVCLHEGLGFKLGKSHIQNLYMVKHMVYVYNIHCTHMVISRMSLVTYEPIFIRHVRCHITFQDVTYD
jgi:hypothetical protein